MLSRDDIIKLAREAGWEMGDNLSDGFGVRLERFAALAYEAGAAAEREACEKVCQEKWIYTASGFEMADYIRARGQA